MLLRAVLAVNNHTLSEALQNILIGKGVEVSTDEALAARSGLDVVADLLVVDELPQSAESLLGSLRAVSPHAEIVLVSDREEEEIAKILGSGVAAVLAPTLTPEQLANPLESILERIQECADPGLDPEDPSIPSLSDFVSKSRPMQDFLSVVRRVAPSETTLLILGETGVGKERLAQAIHLASNRREGPFVAVNCAAIPETLIESELFGHERGAFTGAAKAHRGHFELAHGGTIFLDEIGELPTHLQAKLLRVLEERMVQPLGSEKKKKLDLRVIAATNQDLEAEVGAKRFRPDLYYRLSVMRLMIPALRTRAEDISELASRYARAFGKRLGRPGLKLPREVIDALKSYVWPGNVRELVNVMERAVLLAKTDTIELADLPENVGGKQLNVELIVRPEEENAITFDSRFSGMTWKAVRDEVVRALERGYLVAILKRTRGRVGEAARIAGMSERALFEKMRAHNLRKESFKLTEQSEAELPKWDFRI